MAQQALSLALSWLHNQQNCDGGWSASVVHAADASPIITAGLVASQLHYLSATNNGIGAAIQSRAWSLLLRRRAQSGGWAASEFAAVDWLSTSLGLLSAPRITDPLDDLAPECEALLEKVDAALNTPLLAYAGLALSRFTAANQEALDRIRSELCTHVAGLFARARTGDIVAWFALAAIAELLANTDSARDMQLTLADCTVAEIDNDGCIMELESGSPCPLRTALAVSVLTRIDRDRHSELIEGGIFSLLSTQRSDGSWPSVSALPDTARPSHELTARFARAGCDSRVVTATIAATLYRATSSKRQNRIALPRWPRPNLTQEDASIDEVVREFDRAVAELPERLRMILHDTALFRRRGAGLSHHLPFMLNRTLAQGRLEKEARQMALANRFGQIFCILRDAVIDGDSGAQPTLMLALDALFMKFMRGYQALFDADHEFWTFMERYWCEYLEALAREQKQQRRLSFDDEDFAWQRLKTSPIKICAAGMALLTNRKDVLPDVENLVDTLQGGYQHLDDLADWQKDLEHGHWTWPLTLAMQFRRDNGIEGPVNAEAIEKLLLDGNIVPTVLGRASDRLHEARQLARQLDFADLYEWLTLLHDEVRRVRDRTVD